MKLTEEPATARDIEACTKILFVRQPLAIAGVPAGYSCPRRHTRPGDTERANATWELSSRRPYAVTAPQDMLQRPPPAILNSPCAFQVPSTSGLFGAIQARGTHNRPCFLLVSGGTSLRDHMHSDATCFAATTCRRNGVSANLQAVIYFAECHSAIVGSPWPWRELLLRACVDLTSGGD